MCKDILENIRSVKTYCWEAAFENKINRFRSQELSLYRKNYMLMILVRSIPKSLVYFCLILMFYLSDEVYENLSVGLMFAMMQIMSYYKDNIQFATNEYSRISMLSVIFGKITELLNSSFDNMASATTDQGKQLKDGEIIMKNFNGHFIPNE